MPLLKEWGNCLLYTVTCYVLVSSPHYFFFFKLHVLYPFLHILNLSLTFAHYLFLACGWVGSLWKKSWKSMYENNKQFISNTTEKLQMFLVSSLICLFPLFLFLSMLQMNTLIVSDVVKLARPPWFSLSSIFPYRYFLFNSKHKTYPILEENAWQNLVRISKLS